MNKTIDQAFAEVASKLEFYGLPGDENQAYFIKKVIKNNIPGDFETVIKYTSSRNILNSRIIEIVLKEYIDKQDYVNIYMIINNKIVSNFLSKDSLNIILLPSLLKNNDLPCLKIFLSNEIILNKIDDSFIDIIIDKNREKITGQIAKFLFSKEKFVETFNDYLNKFHDERYFFEVIKYSPNIIIDAILNNTKASSKLSSYIKQQPKDFHIKLFQDSYKDYSPEFFDYLFSNVNLFREEILKYFQQEFSLEKLKILTYMGKESVSNILKLPTVENKITKEISSLTKDEVQKLVTLNDYNFQTLKEFPFFQSIVNKYKDSLLKNNDNTVIKEVGYLIVIEKVELLKSLTNDTNFVDKIYKYSGDFFTKISSSKTVNYDLFDIFALNPKFSGQSFEENSSEYNNFAKSISNIYINFAYHAKIEDISYLMKSNISIDYLHPVNASSVITMISTHFEDQQYPLCLFTEDSKYSSRLQLTPQTYDKTYINNRCELEDGTSVNISNVKYEILGRMKISELTKRSETTISTSVKNSISQENKNWMEFGIGIALFGWNIKSFLDSREISPNLDKVTKLFGNNIKMLTDKITILTSKNSELTSIIESIAKQKSDINLDTMKEQLSDKKTMPFIPDSAKIGLSKELLKIFLGKISIPSLPLVDFNENANIPLEDHSKYLGILKKFAADIITNYIVNSLASLYLIYDSNVVYSSELSGELPNGEAAEL